MRSKFIGHEISNDHISGIFNAESKCLLLENVLSLSLRLVHSKSDFDLLPLRFQNIPNLRPPKFSLSYFFNVIYCHINFFHVIYWLIYDIFMRGLNYQFKFERDKLHSYLPLVFKVKHLPKFGNRAKFNING